MFLVCFSIKQLNLQSISVQNPSGFLPSSLQLLQPHLFRKNYFLTSLLREPQAFKSSFIERTTLFCPHVSLTYDDLLKQQNSITGTNSMSRFGHRHADSWHPTPSRADVAGTGEWPTQHVVSTCRGNRKSKRGVHYEGTDQRSFF